MNSSLSKKLFDHFASLSPKVGKTIRDAFQELVRGSSSNVAPFGDTFLEEEETEDVYVLSCMVPDRMFGQHLVLNKKKMSGLAAIRY